MCCLGAILFASCSSTSSLQKGEKLYTGADLTMTTRGEIPDEDELSDQLERLITPDPNGKLFGLFRVKLWMYNAGIFKKSMGEPPVLLQSVQPDRVASRMKSLLESKGYFLANVRYKVNEEAQKANIEYKVEVSTPYVIDSVVVEGAHAPLLDSIRIVMPKTLLRKGVPYDLATLRAERVRIDSALKDRGYFYFSPEFLYFKADSTAGSKSVDLYLNVKKGLPEGADRIYQIGDVYINSGYTLTRDSAAVLPADTTIVDGFHYVDIDKKFDPPPITRSVYLHKGDPYRRENHDLTLNRLMNLGVFKFVNVRFEERDSADVPRLDTQVYLTPQLMKTIRFELQGVSKSNNFAGPVVNSSYQNKNLFKSAVLFKLNLEAGFEASISSKQGGNSYDVSLRGELQFPRFITPFDIDDVSSLFVPKTRVALGFRLLDRLQYYQMISGDATFGYTWKESLNKQHDLNPFAFTFARLTRRTDKFTELLRTNPFLRKSFEEQFIIGPNYSFTYNDQLDQTKKNHVYFKGSADFSGNILYAAQSLITGKKGTSDNPHMILGTVYSQYSKFDIDLRHYYNSVSQTTMLASRLIAGVGFPYGNSSTLPYVKQFYIAGSNSIRAFEPRTLGPGSYRIPDSLVSSAFNDQAGDVKLEANLDFRFPIVSIVRGALFLDAGNIWLLHDDPGRPGSKFSTKTFLDEIAVGTGFGIRFDLSFFVLRFDIAWPLRVPSNPPGERWIADRIKFWNRDWMKNNLVLNIAIGYPF
ncbi:MAG TPA: BamA/TamA family outer membrane protein [Bacteroidota bacterium]|nr:BamA/TamA family outer membrane protein [Bacteroidota bacterium]